MWARQTWSGGLNASGVEFGHVASTFLCAGLPRRARRRALSLVCMWAATRVYLNRGMLVDLELSFNKRGDESIETAPLYATLNVSPVTAKWRRRSTVRRACLSFQLVTCHCAPRVSCQHRSQPWKGWLCASGSDSHRGDASTLAQRIFGISDVL